MQAKNLSPKLQRWHEHYNASLEAKQSYTEYCKQHGLSEPAFAQARAELRKQGIISNSRNRNYNTRSITGPGFAEVVVKQQTQGANNFPTPFARLTLPGDITITFPITQAYIVLAELLGGSHDSSR